MKAYFTVVRQDTYLDKETHKPKFKLTVLDDDFNKHIVWNAPPVSVGDKVYCSFELPCDTRLRQELEEVK